MAGTYAGSGAAVEQRPPEAGKVEGEVGQWSVDVVCELRIGWVEQARFASGPGLRYALNAPPKRGAGLCSGQDHWQRHGNRISVGK